MDDFYFKQPQNRYVENISSVGQRDIKLMLFMQNSMAALRQCVRQRPQN